MDAELPSTVEERMMKARKKHLCCECKIEIQPKEMYSRVKGFWPGHGWLTFKTCKRCEELRQKLTDPDFGPAPFGQLSDSAHDAGIDILTWKKEQHAH